MTRKDIRLVKSVAVAITLLAEIRVAGSAAAQSPVALGAVEKVTVHGKSLEGNLDGDTPDRLVFVYLPPSYRTDVKEDGLLGVNRQLDALLTQAGIPHRFETYDGNHNNKVFERIETRVLPFFSTNLEFK